MPTLQDIEDSDELPWGLHDAMLEQVAVDWTKRELASTSRVKMDERQTTERRIRITLTGLVYFVADAPTLFETETPTGLWIDANRGRPKRAAAWLPPEPEGTFAHYLFSHDDNAVFAFCARDASFAWLDSHALPVVKTSGFHLPGDTVPDPT